MKKNWAIVFGVILIIDGIGTITTDFRAAAFYIVSGAIFTALWILVRKRASYKKSNANHKTTSHIPPVEQLRTQITPQPTTQTAPKPATPVTPQPTVQTSPPAPPVARTSTPVIPRPTTQDAPRSTLQTPQPITQATPPAYKFSVEIPGFRVDDQEPQNLDFYRDKLNSRKALTSFDTYVVLDCETTGLSPKSDEIIEIALLKYVKGELTDTFTSLVAPSRPISSRITEITGITNSDLENAPEVQDVIPQVWHFIYDFVLVGHNIPFDIGFLKKEFAKNGFEGRFNYVDTLQLARTAFPDFPNHKLSTCIERLSLSDGQTHRALDDVVCTQRLLEKCLPILLERKEQELAERRAKKAALNAKSE